MMGDLDYAYAQLLQRGFLVLRQAVDSGDQDWVRAEVAFLHNVPSLIGEENVERHRYFWNEERRHYLDWIASQGSEAVRSRMRTYYEPLWSEMEPLVLERLQMADRS
ncbi:MAG: hypothetical protein KY475_05870 [Planctomycetes bacterium]|nr:hypothetical protein [Planctomycetota bacterium]